MKLQVDVNVESLDEAAEVLLSASAALRDGEPSGYVGVGGRFEVLVPVEEPC